MTNDKILSMIVEESSIEVPKNLVEEELRMLMIEDSHRMQYENLTTGYMAALTEAEKEERYRSMYRDAYTNIKTERVIQSYIDENSVEVTTAELEREAAEMAKRQDCTMEQIKGFFGNDFGLLRRDVLFDKAVELMCREYKNK